MPLDATILAQDIDSRFAALYGDDVSEDERLEALTEFCEAIVEHIKANAVVMPTALLAPQNAGPVTGTGTIV